MIDETVEDSMNKIKQWSVLSLAGVLLVATPLQVSASSPEFARTEEEWNALRDNKIEYEELADLIKEYNATVQKNQTAYREFVNEYGTTKEDVAERYLEIASELQDSLYYPDTDDLTYATVMQQMVSLESNIETYQELAEEALDDSTIQLLTYDMAEASLVVAAQSNMSAYYQNQIQLEIALLDKALLEQTYNSTVALQQVGMATEAECLSALEQVQKTDQTILSAQSAIENSFSKLIVMLGWNYDDTPEIGELPLLDLSLIDQMDPTVDVNLAIENNYALKINQRQLENAISADTIEILEETIEDDKNAIGTDLVNLKQEVLTEKTSYELTVLQAELAQSTWSSISTQYQLGMVTRTEYEKQQIETQIAEYNVELAEYSLRTAMESYEWAVNGLAQTS